MVRVENLGDQCAPKTQAPSAFHSELNGFQNLPYHFDRNQPPKNDHQNLPFQMPKEGLPKPEFQNLPYHFPNLRLEPSDKGAACIKPAPGEGSLYKPARPADGSEPTKPQIWIPQAPRAVETAPNGKTERAPQLDGIGNTPPERSYGIGNAPAERSHGIGNAPTDRAARDGRRDATPFESNIIGPAGKAEQIRPTNPAERLPSSPDSNIIGPAGKGEQIRPGNPAERVPAQPADRLPSAPAVPADRVPAVPADRVPSSPLDRVTPPAGDRVPPTEAKPRNPLDGLDIRTLDPKINPRLGCALAVSSDLHRENPNIAVTNNNQRLEAELRRNGYEMVMHRGQITDKDVQPGDVLIGYRRDGMPGHAARVTGNGRVFENNSDTGRMHSNGDLNQFNMRMHDKNGKWQKNGFDYVVILRRGSSGAQQSTESNISS